MSALEDLRAWWLVFRDTIRLADAIDILIVAVVIHVLLLWLRRRGSRAVVVTVALLVVLHLTARQLDLVLTPWLLQAGVTALMVGLILVFQNDIRRACEHLAARIGIIERPSDKYGSVASLLAGALGALASQRIGVLVVLPGREPLEPHVTGGVPLDGRLSAPLLESIFDPSSNGHDGAAIIDDGRLVSFGVHLPLSENHALLGDHGTRHAAALGLSERCDALVLIASEELGTIKVARHGVLEQVGDEGDLRSIIERFNREVGADDGSNRRSLLARLRRVPAALLCRWPTKLLSLTLAATLWLAVAYRVEPLVRQFTVPVQFSALPEGLQVRDAFPRAITLTLSGPKHRFTLMDPDQLLVTLDLEGFDPGRHLVTFEAPHVELPAGGVTVSDFSPDGVSFTLARIEERDGMAPPEP